MTTAAGPAAALPPGWLAGGRALAVLGHELRNPLAAVAAGVGAVAAMTDADDPRAPFLHRALADLERLSALLGGYLALAAGRLPPPSEVDLAAVVGRVVARRQPARVRSRCEAGARVSGCAALLERAIDNLVDNALQAGATRIDVRVSTGRGRVAVVVDDDGAGVPEAVRSRLFEPGVSGRSDGSGLGLALVAAIARVHGGRVRLLPQARGTRFVLSLPAASARVAASGG